MHRGLFGNSIIESLSIIKSNFFYIAFQVPVLSSPPSTQNLLDRKHKPLDLKKIRKKFEENGPEILRRWQLEMRMCLFRSFLLPVNTVRFTLLDR